MTARIIAREDDGTETDITAEVDGTLKWLMAWERETPSNLDELRRRIILWPHLGHTAKQWQERLDSELYRMAEEDTNRLRAEFDRETAEQREAQFRAWVEQREEQT